MSASAAHRLTGNLSTQAEVPEYLRTYCPMSLEVFRRPMRVIAFSNVKEEEQAAEAATELPEYLRMYCPTSLESDCLLGTRGFGLRAGETQRGASTRLFGPLQKHRRSL